MIILVVDDDDDAWWTQSTTAAIIIRPIATDVAWTVSVSVSVGHNHDLC